MSYHCKECGSFPHYALGFCKSCYYKDYYRKHEVTLRCYARTWQEENKEHVKKYQALYRSYKRYYRRHADYQ